MFSGEHDELDAVCEVHSGAGGTDAQDWAEMLLRMYLRWAERRGFQVELEEVSPGTEAGISSATFIVQGRHAYGLLSAEKGVHRLVRISPFDSQSRRHTAFASLRGRPLPRGPVGRGRDRREGPAHRHLPLVGRRRPARQRHRLGGAHHPPAHRHRRVLPEPAQPAPEQGPWPCRSWPPSWPSGPGRSGGGSMEALAGEQRDVAWGSQIRSYVLHPVPDGEGPAHRPRGRATSAPSSTATSTASWSPGCAGGSASAA